MSDVPYLLDEIRRPIVLAAIREVCNHRGWVLMAAHVRSNHVHTVVETDGDPVTVMNTFKAYASRGLNQQEGSRKRWARHGSTKWLWKDQDVREAVRYVVDCQGEPMSVHLAEVP
jgi:REP element-mobilizing transposase RayT